MVIYNFNLLVLNALCAYFGGVGTRIIYIGILPMYDAVEQRVIKQFIWGKTRKSYLEFMFLKQIYDYNQTYIIKMVVWMIIHHG